MRKLHLALLTAGIALGLVAHEVQIDNLGPYTTEARSWAIVIAAWLFLGAGLIAWNRQPANRLGLLMVAASFALLLRQLRYSHHSGLFTTFFIVGELAYWVVAWAVFAYPSGRVTDRAEKLLLKVGFSVTFVLTLAIMLVDDGSRSLRFFDPSRRESSIVVYGSGDTAIALQKTFVILVWGVLAAAAIALLLRKLFGATPRARRLLTPLLLAAITVALRAVFESIFTFGSPPQSVYQYLFWWQISAFSALPVALLAGFLYARLARASVGDLVLELERTPTSGIRDALSRTLRDPTLEIFFWLPDRQSYVDAAGRSAELPANRTRSVTVLDHDGKPLAALVHDPSLLDEPKLVGAAAAAARLALENAQLQAETRAQLEQVRESRSRLVTAADQERQRIERNIHDGAQQRLVALAVQLRRAQRKADPELERLLAATVSELKVAVEELRELARGVHPAILTEDGLGPALESLASRSDIPVDLEAYDGRLPSQVEAAAYFVACEALANVAKHSGATSARIRTKRQNETLLVEVSDDGIGGAKAVNGSGLRGLADRVEAVGGKLRVESPAGDGTRVIAEIPCA